MPTDTARNIARTPSFDFVLRGVLWSLGLFGLMRLGWFETHAVLPLTQVQARLAVSVFGAPALPIEVTLACSGADAFALCVGAILAYPTLWRMRLAGAAGGMALILALNTTRIGTLGLVAASPTWFSTLHLYAWPAVLTVAIAGFVFTWMRYTDRRQVAAIATTPMSLAEPRAAVLHQPTRLTPRFVALTITLLVLFAAAGPLYLESSIVLAVASFIARAAASTLGVLGVSALAIGNVLWTTRGGFVVTQECVSTPLIPVYLAGAVAYSQGWRQRAPALLAVVPLFVGLGIARLLVVALPAALVESPLSLVHAFYQWLLAGVVVLLAAIWRHDAGPRAWRRAFVGGALGALFFFLVHPGYAWASAGAPLEDPQGAIALLPSFQVGLYVALSVAAFVGLETRLFAAGLAALGLSQVAGFAVLHFLAQHGGFAPGVRDVRAWALAAPLLVIAAMVTYARPRR